MSSKENGDKSRNGTSLENLFIQKTGYKKAKKSEKPKFINEHCIEQEIDADFIIERDDFTYFIDVTTTWRSSRAKQKAYNGLLLKLKTDIIHKYIIGVGSLIEGDKKMNPIPLEGVDDILLVEELIQIFKKI